MVEGTLRLWVEVSARGIEDLAVGVIILAVVHGLTRYAVHIFKRVDGAYERFKRQIGRALLLALELMVAADIIETVVLEPSRNNVLTLGLVVMIRTFLSWSIIVEIEGRWPWQAPRGER